MRLNGHARHYDNLAPDERFALDVLAMARGDKEESDLLTRTCPRFDYTMNERGFTGRWLGAMDMTLRMYLEIAAYLPQIKTIEVVRAILPYSETFARDSVFDAYLDGHAAGARHAWSEADKEGEAPEWPPRVDEETLKSRVDPWISILPEILDKVERQQATHALTLWRGFGAFCEESVGVEAGALVKVVLEAGVERTEELEALAERLELEPDAETVEEIREGLEEAWRVVEKRGA
jgi:hypothetical protein